MTKKGKCEMCGKYSEKLQYFKGFYYCPKCFKKLTKHMVPFNEVYA